MKSKSEAKAVIVEAIEREREYLNSQGVGTDEYNESLKRLISLEEKLAELEKTDFESFDQLRKFVLSAIQIGVCGIALPLFGLIVLTAQEREISYVGACKSLLSAFVPGKKTF